MPSEIRLAHERDAAWLLALWITIHHGDPAAREGEVLTHDLQQGAAARAITALAEGLDEKARKAVLLAVAPTEEAFPLKVVEAKVAEARLAAFGIRFTRHPGEPSHAITPADRMRVRTYCVRFGGARLCVDIRLPDPHLFA
jgi:hypothetical protein